MGRSRRAGPRVWSPPWRLPGGRPPGGRPRLAQWGRARSVARKALAWTSRAGDRRADAEDAPRRYVAAPPDSANARPRSGPLTAPLRVRRSTSRSRRAPVGRRGSQPRLRRTGRRRGPPRRPPPRGPRARVETLNAASLKVTVSTFALAIHSGCATNPITRGSHPLGRASTGPGVPGSSSGGAGRSGRSPQRARCARSDDLRLPRHVISHPAVRTREYACFETPGGTRLRPFPVHALSRSSATLHVPTCPLAS